MACRRATWPTRISPSLLKPTTDGVSRWPSSFSMTLGSRPSMIATTELVVPRSIPMIFFAIALFLPKPFPRLLGPAAVRRYSKYGRGSVKEARTCCNQASASAADTCSSRGWASAGWARCGSRTWKARERSAVAWSSRCSRPSGLALSGVPPFSPTKRRQGAVYLGDFGVARAAGNTEVTAPGSGPKGKVGYMAPEQASGRTVTAVADIFALGRVVAEAADLDCGPALRAVIQKATAENPK